MGRAGLDDNLLSSLSQGSNRTQSNGKRVFGELNVLSSNRIQSNDERVFGDFNVDFSVNGIRKTEKRNPVDKHDETNSALKYCMGYTIAKASVPHSGMMLVIKL
ncbi:hypothetical protein RJ640_007302 [Escallonia rubra]|uniref:Uncharacterized protein n=1 Tax=Escallonia rubra TaxID=112253 RepID=A0AA88UU67_9ASTE|nr:hypothetical protein RJ640_007302 [Escallonia rubra]